MILVVAQYERFARHFMRTLGLAPTDWRYIYEANELRGQHDRPVWFVGDWQRNRSLREIDELNVITSACRLWRVDWRETIDGTWGINF